MDFVIGGLAAAGAGFFSNPLDVLKTRLQLQGELRARGQHTIYYKNVIHAAMVVVKNDGIWGLQKGLAPAVVMHTIRNSVRLGIYQSAKNRSYITDENGKTLFYRSLTIGGISGAAGAFLASPLFMIKTQLQSQTTKSVAVGHQHGHSGTVAALRQIYRDYGVMGLWRGVNGTVLRALAGSSSQLTSFAMTKDMLRKYQLLENSPVASSFIASIIGGVFQVLTITPFDLVSIRLYNQPVNAQGLGTLYKGIGDCFVKIWKTEGFFGFYKGVAANYLRLAPHGALTLVFWDILMDFNVRYKSNIKQA